MFLITVQNEKQTGIVANVSLFFVPRFRHITFQDPVNTVSYTFRNTNTGDQ